MDPCGTPFLKRRNLLSSSLPMVKLRFPTSSMIMRTMYLSGSNRSRSSLQEMSRCFERLLFAFGAKVSQSRSTLHGPIYFTKFLEDVLRDFHA